MAVEVDTQKEMRVLSHRELAELMDAAGKAGKAFLFVADYEMKRGLFMENPLERRDLLWSVGESGNSLPCYADAEGAQPSMRVLRQPTPQEYAEAFAVVRRGLMRGDSFLVNLTGSTVVEASPMEEIFHAARAPYRLLIPGEFVCFSPETFVRISAEGIISAYPMKGTIDAEIPDARERLENDPKELAEHYTIVDLLRNDLAIVASDVRVARFRYFDRVATRRGDIYQTSSEIRGTLPADWRSRLGQIITAMLPAGSICGAPKEATLRIIREAEGSPRGWYTGVFGYFDGRSLDSGVMIRCLQRHPDGTTRFHSGGGITVSSDCQSEYRELLQKIYLTR